MQTVFNQKVVLPLSQANIWLKREDLTDPKIPGNKFRKLKYNLREATRLQLKLLTFGGAFSNHIAAVAAAGRRFGLETIGVIRGDELALMPLNSTLTQAASNGMELYFINREDYRKKESEIILNQLRERFGDFYLLPEGGTNELAIRGCEEILQPADFHFDYICCAVGTGGTLAGLSRAAAPDQKILGFAALKGDFLSAEVGKWTSRENFSIETGYHFGGYAKLTPELATYLEKFRNQNNVMLDPVYTAKMMFGIDHLYLEGFFSASDKVLAVHTGGLQGIDGMKEKLTSLQKQ